MLKLIKVKLKDIKPYENNAKLHMDKEIQKSLDEFGYVSPIGIWREDKRDKWVIVTGHGRYKGLVKKFGKEKEIECIDLSHLTVEQSKAFRIVENQSHMLSSWDTAMLDTELDKITFLDLGEFGIHKSLPKPNPVEHNVCCPECGLVFDTNKGV